MMFVDCSAMSFCKKIVCFLTPRQVLRKGLLGLFLAGFALLAGSVWAEAINTESATAKYVAPFEMAASQAAASPRQVERAVKATLTDDQRIAAEVAALLARNPLFTDVRPLVNGSVVQLEGSVRNAEAKELATKLAESVKGVVAVDNALIVSADFRSQLGEVIRKVRDRLVQLITSIPMFLLAIMVLVLFNWIGRGLAAHPGLLGFRPHYGNTYFQSLIRRGIRIAFIAVGFLVALDLLDSTALVGALLGSVSIIGVTLGFLLVQVINTILSYFVMIKPVLGSSYRQYMLSLWLPFYLSIPTLVISYGLGIVLQGQLALSLLLGLQVAAGALAFAVTIVLSRHPLVAELKRPFCRSEKMKTLLRAG